MTKAGPVRTFKVSADEIDAVNFAAADLSTESSVEKINPTSFQTMDHSSFDISDDAVSELFAEAEILAASKLEKRPTIKAPRAKVSDAQANALRTSGWAVPLADHSDIFKPKGTGKKNACQGERAYDSCEIFLKRNGAMHLAQVAHVWNTAKLRGRNPQNILQTLSNRMGRPIRQQGAILLID